MTQTTSQPVYDLEDRTLQFAMNVRKLLRALPKSIINIEDGKQLVRSSGSVGANYIEGNEALGKKDFIMRMKIARKEAKESRYWLQLLEACDENSDKLRLMLIQEATELLKILNAIVVKAS